MDRLRELESIASQITHKLAETYAACRGTTPRGEDVTAGPAITRHMHFLWLENCRVLNLIKKKKCQQSNETVAQIADNFCKTWANICGRGNRSDSSTTNRSWNLCEGTIHNKTHTHTHTRICQLSTSIMSTHGFSTTIFEHNYEKRFSRTTPRRHLEVWVVPGWLGERGWAWLGHQGLHGTR